MGAAKYYTQFILSCQIPGGNEFSGVIELSKPLDSNAETEEIEAILAKNFELEPSIVKLVVWSRLH